MTNTYNTLNPLGSTSPKDLFDNASNFDDAMNSPSPSFTDRFGLRRETWAGMEKAFDDFLLASGYQFIGDYDADGPLTITQQNQVFTKDGEYWRSSPTLALPYTTVNNWVTDQPKFVSVGDAALRQDLALPSGSSIVGFSQGGAGAVPRSAQDKMRDVVSVEDFGAVGDGLSNNYAALLAADALGEVLHLGKGSFRVSSNLTLDSSIVFAGGSFLVDAGVTLTLNGALDAQAVQLFSGAGTVVGSPKNYFVYPEWFGAKAFTASDQAPAINKAIRFAEQSGTAKQIKFLGSLYRCDTGVSVVAPFGCVKLLGAGSSTRAEQFGTTLDFSNAAATVTGITVAATTAAPMWGYNLENINIYRSVSPTKGSDSAGIRLAAMQNGRIKDCVISGFDFCIDLLDVNSPGATCINNILEGLHVSRYASRAIRALGAVATSFRKIEFASGTPGYDSMLFLGKALFSVQCCDSNSFDDCVLIDGSAMAPLIVEMTDGGSGNGLDNRFTNCVFEQASGAAIQTGWIGSPPDPTVRQIYVDRCWFNNVGRAFNNVGAPIQGSIVNSRINTTGTGGAIFYTSTAGGISTVDFQVVNNHISFSHVAASGIEFYKHRGFLAMGNTIRAQGAGSARPTVYTDANTDQARVLANHSITTFASVDGTSQNGTNPVSANNTLATG